MSGVSREDGMATKFEEEQMLAIRKWGEAYNWDMKAIIDALREQYAKSRAEAAREDSGTPAAPRDEKQVYQQGIHDGLQMAANYVQAHDNLGDIAAKEILDLERHIPAAFAELVRGEDSGTAPTPRTCDACGAEVREVSADLYRCVSCATCYTLEGFLKLGAVGAVPETKDTMTDEKILDLLASLDSIARDVDHYDYGLPLHNEEQHGHERMIQAVKGWLAAPSVESAATADATVDMENALHEHLLLDSITNVKNRETARRWFRYGWKAARRASVPGEKESNGKQA